MIKPVLLCKRKAKFDCESDQSLCVARNKPGGTSLGQIKLSEFVRNYYGISLFRADNA